MPRDALEPVRGDQARGVMATVVQGVGVAARQPTPSSSVPAPNRAQVQGQALCIDQPLGAVQVIRRSGVLEGFYPQAVVFIPLAGADV